MASTLRSVQSGDAQATEPLIEVATSFYQQGGSQIDIARELRAIVVQP